MSTSWRRSCAGASSTCRTRRAARSIRDMWVRGAPLIGGHGAYGMALQMRARTRPTPWNTWRDLQRDPPHRDQPALGADEMRACCAAAAAERARGRLSPRRRDRRRGRRRSTAGQRADPLQCRLAGHGRLGHGAGADLPGARRRHGRCMSGSTRRGRATRAPASPRGSWASRRAAHGDRRQRRRPPDAARPGRHGDRRHRPHDARGDVCNKIGTYLKALAAHDNGVPFYVGLPSSIAGPQVLHDGVAEIPIEERSAREQSKPRSASASPRSSDGARPS
jgi:methylthioribose-1-phosphate isomerase